MIDVLLGVGSNIEPKKNILHAVHELKRLDPNCQFSSLYEFEAVGFDGANVFNFVAKIKTSLALEALVKRLKAIELRYGKSPQAKKFMDRSIDIDLLTYGNLCQPEGPPLPRADIYQYAFVLLPLAELCPNELIPGDTQTYAKAWYEFKLKHNFTPISITSIDTNTI